MVEEMIKLRKVLDNSNIEWEDKSEKWKLEQGGSLGIDRTHFNYKGQKISVINGFGTYGGYTFGNENKGLLELSMNGREPIGNLTAREVVDELKRS